MKKILISAVTILVVNASKAQTVSINTADKQIPLANFKATTAAAAHIVHFSASGIVANKVAAVTMVNTNQGTAASSYYTLGPVVYNSSIANGYFNLSISDTSYAPATNQTIVVRFRMDLNDSVAFFKDTITIAGTSGSNAHWYRDSTNTVKYEVNQFTDFLGFDNQKPNGLLQQEFIFKFPLVKTKTGNCSSAKVFFQPFRSVVFHALLNRIDKTNASQEYPVGTTLPNNPANLNNLDSIRPYLTTMDIFRYSNLQIGLKLNMVTFHIGNFRLSAEYEFNLLRNKPYYADTIKFGNASFTRDQVRAVYSFAHKIGLFGNTAKLMDNQFKVSFNAGAMFIRLRDSYYKQYDAAVIDPVDRVTTLLSATDVYAKNRAKPIWYFSGMLSKYWGEKNKNSIFFRVNYFYQTGKFRRYGGSNDLSNFDPKAFYDTRFYNHFLQLQLGIALDLNKFLGVKEEK